MTPAELPPDAIPGYQVLSEVHRGSQGVVYLAVQESSQQKVALKMMLQSRFADSISRRRFEREIELVGSLDHPNIAKLFDSGIVRGQFYFAMQFIQGMTLTDHVRDKQLSINSTLHLFKKVCDAVGYAHQRGVIHRDLKPSNILVDEDSHEPFVVDFGLAKIGQDSVLGGSHSFPLSITGQIVGTPAFMSPEQAAGETGEVDLRTDVYALGVVLYVLTTGQMPYEVKGSLADMWTTIRETEPTRLRRVNPEISDEVETIVLKALSKDKDRRYATAGMLGDDVARCLGGEPIEAKRDSLLYVFRNTLRRYKAIAAAATALAIVIAIALVTSLAFWRQAVQARDLAEQEKDRALIAQDAERQARETADELASQLRQQLYEYNLGRAVTAWESGALLKTGQYLAECPTSLRRWEWDWLDAQVVAAGLTLFPGQGRPAFTPDGTLLVAAGRGADSGAIRIWDAPSGRSVTSLRGSSNSRLQMALSPDASRIAAAHYDGSLVMWDRVAEEELWRVQPSESRPDGLAFRRDGALIALATVNGHLRLHDTETGDEVRNIGPLSYPLRDVAFRPGGMEIAAGALAISPQPATVWGLPSGEKQFTLPANGNADCVAYSHDGRYLVTGGVDQHVTMWNADTGEMVQEFPGHSGTVFSVAFSPDDRQVASAGSDGTVRLWQVDNRQEIAQLADLGMSSIYWLCFHPDGEQIAFYTHEGIVNWNTKADRDRDPNLTVLAGHRSNVRSIDFSPDGSQLVSVGFDQTIRVWDVEMAEELRTFEGHSHAVVAVAYGPRGRCIISGSHHNNLDKPCELMLWDAETGEVLHSLAEHQGGVWWIAIHPDGTRFAAGGMDGILRMWEIESGQLLFELDRHFRYIEGIAFSHDGEYLVTIDAGENILKFWDANTGRPIGRSTTSVDQLRGRCVRFSPNDALIATGGVGGVARLWDGKTGELIYELRGHEGHVTSVAFNSDSTRLFTAGHDKTINVWSTETGKRLLQIGGHTDRIWTLAVSSDGNTIASAGDDGTIRIWSVEGNSNQGSLRRPASLFTGPRPTTSISDPTRPLAPVEPIVMWHSRGAAR